MSIYCKLAININKLYNCYMKEFIIPKKYEKKDIYSTIKKIFPNLPLSVLNKVFILKDIKVNYVRVNKYYIE